MNSQGLPYGSAAHGRYDQQTEQGIYPQQTAYGMSAGGQTAPPNSSGLPRPGDSSIRAGYGRQPSDMQSLSYGQQGQSYYSQSPQGPQGSMGVPGSLQPGSGRPAAISQNTAPSAVPTLPPISTQSQPYQTSSRGSTTHSHSRSSPADSRYPTTPSKGYMSAQTPQTATFSPLGLADIRAAGDAGGEEFSSAYGYDDNVPGNCNFQAPWPVYAFDWCKWPVPSQGLGDSAGKIAIGSYLEDGHNYVRCY